MHLFFVVVVGVVLLVDRCVVGIRWSIFEGGIGVLCFGVPLGAVASVMTGN